MIDRHRIRPVPAPEPRSGYFAHEKLRVYHQALEFARWTQKTQARLRGRPRLRDQLHGVAESMVLNTAEGATYHGKRRVNHFEIALASAAEALSILDLLEIAGIPTGDAEAILRSYGAGMAKLIQRWR